MELSKKFVVCGVGFGILGMVLGMVMAATKDYGQHVTHAHILLVGTVLSMLYGLVHRLWLTEASSPLRGLQFWLHLLGAAFMSVALYLAYGNYLSFQTLEPVLVLSSLAVLLSLSLLGWLLLTGKAAA